MKEAREKKGLKQNELAKKINVSPQTISAYEKAVEGGRGKNPTLENAMAIAKELDVSLDWLCGIGHVSGFTTYGDVAYMIAYMLKAGIATFDNGPVSALVFKDKPLATFIQDLRQMNKLLGSKAFSTDFYNRWLDDRIQALSRQKK